MKTRSIFRRNARLAFRRRNKLRSYWRKTKLAHWGQRVRINQGNPRIFRKFLRKVARPELKSVVTSSSAAVSSGGTYTNALTMASIPEGDDSVNRVGRQIKVIKFDAAFYMTDNSSITITAPTVSTFMFRLIVWTPRRPYASVSTYMTGLAWLDFIDQNQVNVMYDQVHYVTPRYFLETTSIDQNHGPYPNQKLISMTKLFPRNVKFAGGDNTLDPDRDIVYFTVVLPIVPNTALNINPNVRTWFYDA